MKLYFNANQKLENTIIIKKMGITFRKITSEEVKDLLNVYKEKVANRDNMYLVNYFIKNIHNNNVDFCDENQRKKFEEFNRKFDSLSEEGKKLIYNLVIKKDDNKSLDVRIIKKRIEHYTVVDINEEEFEKLYPIEYANYFISKLAELTFFLNSIDLFLDNIEDNSLLANNKDIINNKTETILDFFIEDEYRKINISYNYIQKIANLTDNKDIYSSMFFLSIIDTLFDKRTSLDNKIVNKTGIIERLLIKKDDSKIEKSFILKVGIIVKKSDLNYIQDLSKILATIYQIRSYIAHGNEKELFSKLNDLAKILSVNDLTTNKFKNKIKLLATVNTYLDLFLKEILLCYINDNDYCNYIKEN